MDYTSPSEAFGLMKKALIVLMLLAKSTGLVAQATAYRWVDFYDLANFAYNPKEPYSATPHRVTPSGVPARLLPLNGQKVTIIGAVMPVTWEEGGSNEFMLMLSQDLCGFGAIPRLNEFIYVKMTGGRKVIVQQGNEYQVKGVFHLQETVEDGRVTMLYSMDGDSVQ